MEGRKRGRMEGWRILSPLSLKTKASIDTTQEEKRNRGESPTGAAQTLISVAVPWDFFGTSSAEEKEGGRTSRSLAH